MSAVVWTLQSIYTYLNNYINNFKTSIIIIFLKYLTKSNGKIAVNTYQATSLNKGHAQFVYRQKNKSFLLLSLKKKWHVCLYNIMLLWFQKRYTEFVKRKKESLHMHSSFSQSIWCFCTLCPPFHRPPTLPPKPQKLRKPRPRSSYNHKLFNGNMETFIEVPLVVVYDCGAGGEGSKMI